ncbi:UbiA prenyltransferase [uncultured Paludibacter sp.]|uniref:UbiA prenyltransferase n=1 Tax=uncultured Paludibacter sp. TaxID=497635 RepID=A0A653A5Q1_9BACT|nr:UbiA prenyltransferase [uncultured Paludibacter sp.]
MTAYFNIVRWKNLLFVALIQWLMQHTVVFPILQTFGFETREDSILGYVLMAATVFIAAGGYVINDYFDVKIDRINKLEKVIVTEKISKENAMHFYQILTGLGVVSGLALAFITKSFSLAFIFILVPGLLWFYSASYKRQFIWGNLVVSFLAALTVFIVGILEISILRKEYGALLYQTHIPKVIYGWTGGFAFFAFISTWIREIIKDIEDENGDREMECRTMPIKWGIQKTKYFLYGLIVFSILALFHFQYHYIHFEGTLTLRYIIFGLALPFAALIYLIFRAKTPDDFKQTATLSKFIMLIGILYSVVFYYLQAKTYHLDFFGLFIIK